MVRRPTRRSRSTAGSPKSVQKESVGSVLRFVLTVAILAWAFRSLIGAPFNIPSGSMLPTLYIGDYVAVAKWPYGYSRYSFPLGQPAFDGRIFGRLPRRGDVVVFRHPGEDADLIKRVIGLPGDRVAMSGGRLILNGQMVPREPLPPAKVPVTANSPCKAVPPATPMVVVASETPACVYHAFLETLPGGPSYTVLDQVDHGPADDFMEMRVPAGHVFLMGDNRDDSLDSRFPADEGGIGMVPAENLIGRAAFTFWSTDGRASWLTPWTWFPALRAGRIGNGYTGVAK
ncbi:signal peptidase I [Sphingomonas sp.]|uniref:signal peptidase I n=1 Tax=Sphingomonas sp. TaxID=28214 RepID=UPI0038AEF550